MPETTVTSPSYTTPWDTIHAVQLWPVPASAGGDFLENAAAAGGLERSRLQGVYLFFAFGHAGIAEQQAFAARRPGFRVCALRRGPRQLLANLLSISCFRIAAKGNLFMNWPHNHPEARCPAEPS
jgi:hypothetical protein